ncbi:MAG: deoxyribodipyrimidine photo-lyase [Bacteroidetes bacterium]|nr:deoxyribodipyrimidine photo-lyase [Bacteroidota bacterium]
MKPVSVFWFRRDLRLHDNHGFYQALKSADAVLPVFIFDKNVLNKLADKKDKRVSFIHQTLNALNIELQKFGSSLLVLYGEPLNAFKTICESFLVKNVFTNQDYEPYAIERDRRILDWLKSKDISFLPFKDQVIFEKQEILKLDKSPYTIFTPYSKIWKRKIAEEKIEKYSSQKLLSKLFKTEPFHFPSLTEIGFDIADIQIPPVEIEKNIIKNYHLTRNLPAVNGTSKLSIHLRFGTVSIRELAAIAIKLNEQWLNEIIWREFFMMILFHFPHVVNKSFKRKYENIEWRNDEAEFKKWCDGETGYPIVDAGMRELNETGFMHNRVRMIVASFLTKHLLIDWRWGEAYFAEKLLDYELSSNNGNWQWAAGCGCDAAPYFRIFNPTEQTKRFDQEMVYTKKWINNFTPNYLPPIVEHSFARRRALEVFKKALHENF